MKKQYSFGWGPVAIVAAIVLMISTGAAFAAEPAPFGEVTRLTWVVKDLDGVVSYWRKAGLGKIDIEKNIRVTNELTKYKGNFADAVVDRGVTYIAGVKIEIIRPLQGVNGYAEFLKTHGDGIYTVGFNLGGKEEFDDEIDRLWNEKIGILERGAFDTHKGQGHYVLLDTQPVGGIAFELRYDPAFTGAYPEAAEYEKSHQYPFNGRIVQYAMVAGDVDSLASFYTRLGFTIRNIDRNFKSIIARYRGEDEDFRMHMGWSKLGSITLEILDPTMGRNIYDEYLDRHGSGFHHLAFNVDDMDEAVEIFKKRGVGVSQDGAWGKKEVEGRFAYLDTEPFGGLSIELLWSK